MNKSKKLIFFGSGPVGKATLEALYKLGFDIEAIITKPKAAHHRGSMPVLDFAEKKKITAFTPGSKDELKDLFTPGRFSSQLGLVVDYGLIIPKDVINYFPLGIVNSHFSLLPQWRGADPITFALLSGQKTTGVSIMLIDSGLDTGKLLAQADYDIASNENIITLTDNLVDLSNQTLDEALPLYVSGQIVPFHQDPKQPASYSRRLTKEDGVVRWDKPAEVIERQVRAYLGWPKSQAKVHGKPVIILKARVAKNKEDGQLVLSCQPGFLEIIELIGPSGKTMSGADFLRGYQK